MRVRRFVFLGASALCVLLGAEMGAPVPARAQTTTPAPKVEPAPADPVLAKVGDQTLRLSDLRAALASLPANIRQLPPQTLYPMLLDRLIDQMALAQEAERTGLAKDPEIARQVKLAKTLALGSAMLSHAVAPQVTEAAVKAQYQKEYASKPAPEEVHAKHILVDNEATANQIIAQLKNGANWDDLAKKYSQDKGATDGGDLGWFTKQQMVPPFAEEAFKLKPGEVSPEPVHTRFGWHVIKVLGRRQGKVPSFDEVKQQIAQKLAQNAAEQAIKQALSQTKVERFQALGARPPAGGK